MKSNIVKIYTRKTIAMGTENRNKSLYVCVCVCIRIHGCYIIFHLWGESIALALKRIRVSSSAYGYETYCLYHFLLPKFERKKNS